VISVLVVDDSVVVRRLIVGALEGLPDIRVVGTAANGRIALTKLPQLAPDVVTMDIEMPEMDGISTVRELRKTYRDLPVIMFSTLSAAGAAATLDALAAGATDYVTKPANVGSVQASIQAVRDQLVPRIRVLGGRRRAPGGYRAPATPLPTRPVPGPHPHPVPSRPAPTGRIDVLAIGASTGGPDALARVIGALPAAVTVPVLVVQHMPPVFTRMFAERLNRTCAVRVVEAEDAMPISPGTVYIAPGDRHLEVLQRGATSVTRLTGAPPENSCRPAVDVLFRSVARHYGGATLAVILTGMGADGRRGCEELRGTGAEVVAQDEESSVVWGMPGAVVEAGLAHHVLALAEIGPFVDSRITAGHPARPKVVA
jgi:two-component system chemotaxis response regulator CheB